MRNDGQQFRLVLARIGVPTVADIARCAPSALSVETRTIVVIRMDSAHPSGAFGVTRASASWFQDELRLEVTTKIHGRPHRMPLMLLPVGQFKVLELGGHVVVAAAFKDPEMARAWAQERHELPLPKAA